MALGKARQGVCRLNAPHPGTARPASRQDFFFVQLGFVYVHGIAALVSGRGLTVAWISFICRYAAGTVLVALRIEQHAIQVGRPVVFSV